MCSRADLEETYTVLEELCKIVSNPNPNDLKLVEKVKLHKADIKSAIQKKKEEVQNAVADYRRRCQELEEKVANPPGRRFQMQQDVVRGELEDMQHAIEEAKQEIQEQERMVSYLKDQLSNADSSMLNASDLLAPPTNDVASQLAVAESQLRLYSSICPLVFDDNVADGEVKGTVHMMALGEVRPFEWNTRKKDTAEIADELWGMMWEEQEARRQQG